MGSTPPELPRAFSEHADASTVLPGASDGESDADQLGKPARRKEARRTPAKLEATMLLSKDWNDNTCMTTKIFFLSLSRRLNT